MSISKKTEAKIKQALRKIWQFSKEYLDAKAKFKIDTLLFKCNICEVLVYEGESQKTFTKYVDNYRRCRVIMEKGQLDHSDPVVEPEVGFKDWNTYIDRMFLNKMQFLCKPCHASKTADENIIRKARKKLAREKKR
jgi:hypothetical protein